MRNQVDIDHTHSRAIVREIGERLRAFLKVGPELPASLRAQVDRFRQLESPPFSVDRRVNASRWLNSHKRDPWRATHEPIARRA